MTTASRILALILLFMFTGCGTRVNPGYVGIKVNYYGSQRGVEDYPIVTGYVWYNPFTTSVLEYPTFIQTAVWSANTKEGREGRNDEISFNSSEGLNFHADVSLAYALDAAKVPRFYVQFRSDDLNMFTHGFLRTIAQNAFNAEAVHYTAEQIYGDKKDDLLRTALADINSEVAKFGVKIEQFGFLGTPRPPAPVVAQINAKIGAIQDAQRAENRVRQAKAEAAQTVATAQGAAQAAIAKAEGDSRANQVLAASLTPTLLEWRRLELQQQAIAKWNGVQPNVMGSGGLLFNIPAGR